jgi:arsenate reductase
MKRLHVHVAVDDFERSVRFYSIMFAAPPTVALVDYANWILDDPAVNFAIAARGAPGVDHLGIQLEEMAARLLSAGRSGVNRSPATTGFYARCDKAWALDPQGLSWETFRGSDDRALYRAAALARDGAPQAAAGKPYNVLFVCSANAMRSIMAESLINHWGDGRFRGFSAGSAPTGEVDPRALQLLKTLELPTDGLRSKSWHEFTRPAAPPMDFVFTLCEQAAQAAPPAWPGRPIQAFWGVPDPLAAEGSEPERMVALRLAFRALEHRIKLFASLRVDALASLSLQRTLDAIGRDLPARPAPAP